MCRENTELYSSLWKMANNLRGKLGADEFKNYILPLLFYKFLSDKYTGRLEELINKNNLTMKVEELLENEKALKNLRPMIVGEIGYFIETEHIFSSMVEAETKGEFTVELLANAISYLMESTIGTPSERVFKGLFDAMDLRNSNLGSNDKEKSETLSKIIKNLNQLLIEVDSTKSDILGDAYEYLIGQFAANAGKKAGEFYTPAEVSDLIARITTLGERNVGDVYDPTCGSGSLLLQVAKRDESKIGVDNFYGQELTNTTYNLARMNMLLHLVPYNRINIENGDTLASPRHLGKEFDTIVANPPYSAQWEADKYKDDDRFSPYGAVAPKSKADFAFIQHMLHHLKEEGMMAVVLPHGVLFRGAAEGKIRKHIIDKMNCLDAVIGLPANLFFGTSIPTCILIFKKDRGVNKDNILFIDASADFEKDKNQNKLREEDIDKILKAYLNRKDLDKYASVVSLDDIKENDYNLNIPRYVDTFEEEKEIDLEEVAGKIAAIDGEIAAIDKELEGYLKNLGI